MRCQNCGAPAGSNQKICEHCGSPLSSVSSRSQNTTTSNLGGKDLPKEKQLKQTTQMFKEVTKAGTSGAVTGIESMMGAISPMGAAMSALSVIFKVFEPVLKIVGKVMDVFIGQMTAGFIKALMPAIRPLIPLIMKLAPLFEILGFLIGWLIRIGLIPLATIVWAIGAAIASVVDFISTILNILSFGLIQRTNWLGSWNEMMLPVIGGIITGGEYAEGGTVPGAMGAPIMIKAHGQETVHTPSMDADILDELKAINRYNQWNYKRKRSQW